MENKQKTNFSIKQRANSFIYASKGLKLFFTTQHNSWIHLFAAFGVIAAGIFFSITRTEWLFVITAIGLVLVTEVLNTAIEYLIDFISPEYNEIAGKVKDLAAGAVLLAALTAAGIGLLVFGPYLLELL